MLVGIGGSTLPCGYVNPRQEIQVSTSTLGTTEDMRRVIALAREHGILATATQYSFEDASVGLRDLAEHQIAERSVLTF